MTCPISCLKEKEIEWRKVKVEVTPIWVDVYEKNYNKSLDHRSFYFKQTDKKALAKGMTGEIKEASDKKKLSDEATPRGAAAMDKKDGGGGGDSTCSSPTRSAPYPRRVRRLEVFGARDAQRQAR